jgi:hypothetical protein
MVLHCSTCALDATHGCQQMARFIGSLGGSVLSSFDGSIQTDP